MGSLLAQTYLTDSEAGMGDSQSLGSNVEGLLSLYEASYLGMPGEDVLEEARSFTTKMLKHSSTGGMKRYLADQVQQSLEIPLYGKLQRVEARNFIDLYQFDTTLALLELAKLDYNLVQSVYQQEPKEPASWWRELGFQGKSIVRKRSIDGEFSAGYGDHI